MPLTKVTKNLITSVDVSQINTTGSDAGKVLTSNGSTLNWVASSSVGTVITQGTAVTLTNQTSVDFTGIPSTAKRITVMFDVASLNATGNWLLQIGSGSIATTGYSSYVASGGTAFTSTAGFIIPSANATNTYTGTIVLCEMSSNNWVSVTNLAIISSSTGTIGTGSKSLAGDLDVIRLTTVAGTSQFDAGTVNIMWE